MKEGYAYSFLVLSPLLSLSSLSSKTQGVLLTFGSSSGLSPFPSFHIGRRHLTLHYLMSKRMRYRGMPSHSRGRADITRYVRWT